jgi:hypothetical protein
MARVDDCSVSDRIDNYGLYIGHGNSECHLFNQCDIGGGKKGAIQLHGGTVQMVSSFLGCPGWLLDFQPGPYYHQCFVANTDAERGGGWFRSADGCRGVLDLFVVNFNPAAGRDNTPCIEWEAPDSMLSCVNCRMDPSAPGVHAQFGLKTRVSFSHSKLGIQHASFFRIKPTMKGPSDQKGIRTISSSVSNAKLVLTPYPARNGGRHLAILCFAGTIPHQLGASPHFGIGIKRRSCS